MSFPLYRASGVPRALGRLHGEQAQQKIRAFLAYLDRTLQLPRTTLQSRALRFLPLFERHCPHLIEEIRGLAEGAGIEFSEALALQIRGELGQAADGACTTYAVGPRGTADGSILIGQTSDTPAEIEEFAYVLHLAPQSGPELLMWTFGGMIGYHGLNSAGLAQFANSLGGGPAWKFALPHYPLKRLFLECSTLEAAVRVLEQVPVCSSGNYMACGGGTIVDIELTCDGPQFIHDSGAGYLAHSNHFLCGPCACRENFDRSLPDSFPRQTRMQQLIADDFGKLTVTHLQRILSDHDGYPVSICRHPHAGHGDTILPAHGRTVAALIAEPAAGRLHVARGNPCQNPFVTYSLQR